MLFLDEDEETGSAIRVRDVEFCGGVKDWTLEREGLEGEKARVARGLAEWDGER